MLRYRSVSRLGAPVGALVIAGLLVACDGAGEADLLTRAEQAAAQGRYRAAIIDLRNAVSAAPEDAQARYQLAATSLLLGDAATTEKELRRARELGYDAQGSIPEMAQALILLGRTGEALAELAQAREITARIQALHGAAFEAGGDDDQALAAYSAALALDRTEERALLGQARYALAKGDRPVAEQAYSLALREHGTSPEVRLDYGRFLYSQGRATQAIAQYRQALEVPLAQQRLALNWELHFALSEAQLSLAQLEEVTLAIEALDKLRPDHVLVKYLRARLAFEEKEFAVAEELTDRVRVELPEFAAAQLLEAAIQLALGEYKRARLLLDDLASRYPSDAQVRKLLAAAYHGGAKYGEGAVRQALSPESVMSLLGAANAQTGDYAAAVALWQRVLADNPSDEQTRLELATAYLLSERPAQASELLQQASPWTSATNGEKAAVLETLLALRAGDTAQAQRKAAASAEQFPESASISSLQGLIAMGQDRAASAKYFKRALALDGGHTMSMIGLARIAVLNGETDRAIALLRTFVDANPQDAVALDALARNQLREGYVEDARLTLEQARAADPQAVAPRLLLVEVLSRTDKYPSAERVARELVAVRPNLATAHNSLGAALMGQGKVAEGRASLRAALRIDPTALDALRNLARAELAGNDRAQAQQTVEQLLRAHPADPVGLELATRLALGAGRVEEAEGFLAQLVAGGDGTSSTIVSILRGDIARVRGQEAQALRAYEQAAEEALSGALAMRLFQLREARGEGQADAVLREWLVDHPEDQTVRFAAAQYAHKAGDLLQATLDYERMLDADPENVVAWNNLAWAYSDAGDFRALETAQRALDLAAQNPTVQDTYGWMLVLEGQLDNGVSMLRDAWEGAPSAGNIGYHLAASLAQIGETEQAREVLADALQRGGDFTSRAEAEALMGTL